MSNTVARPEHLPDFHAPPLHEVVLGVQFSSPKEYQQIFARDVWDLFRTDYSQVQEHFPLPPSFETFGLPQRPLVQQINFAPGASHDRFWFLRPDGEELLQFQQDRLLHNWRKVGDRTNAYPRFESMIARFNEELNKLQNYLATLAPQTLLINQCEISYINQIYMREDSVPSDWLRVVNFGDKCPDDFSMTFREVIRDESNKPQGRLTCEASSAYLPSGQKIIQLTLTVRGAPQAEGIVSALDFLTAGREIIVQRFTGLTTEMAHKEWGRTK